MATRNPFTKSDTFLEWQTPRGLFDRLDAACGFKVDAAANEANHLLDNYYGPGSPLGEDALAVLKWLSPAFCNPPYGEGMERWLEKFIEQAKLGVTTVAVLPARISTRWWYSKVVPFADIIFLVGRVPFIDPNRTKPSQPDHPSALCFYTPLPTGRVSWMDWKSKKNAKLDKTLSDKSSRVRLAVSEANRSTPNPTHDSQEQRGSSDRNESGSDTGVDSGYHSIEGAEYLGENLLLMSSCKPSTC